MDVFEAKKFMRAYYGGKEPTFEQLTYCADGREVLHGDITPQAQEAATLILFDMMKPCCTVGEGYHPFPEGKTLNAKGQLVDMSPSL